MDVQKSSLLAIFDAKQRLEVPLFQRQYVWSKDRQWLPLWEDIERKFTESLEGREDSPNHFLGAMVLDQKQTPTGHVVVRQVIDGQQRLMTFQIFLSAYRDFCQSQGCDALADECQKFIFNTGMMANPDVDKFKVWPTQLDRTQFSDVVSAGSREELLKRHPLNRRPYKREPEPRPRMVEAYLFFHDCLRSFFLGNEGEPALFCNLSIETRVDKCFQTLRNGLMVVVIDLQKDDDPQVIFETLNARGEPLLPADLLRNYIFFRAGRENLDVEAVYQEYWKSFDDEFRRKEVKQGRLNRPRSDLFIQHFLASRQTQDIPIRHLYIEYRHWIEKTRPFANVTEELATLARQGAHFRRILSPPDGDHITPFCKFLDLFDIRTAYPLLLALMEADVPPDEWSSICDILESYLVRRAVCGLGTKNYNRVFLSITRQLSKEGFSATRLKDLLHNQKGDSAFWPDDAPFRESWLHKPLYSALNSPKLVHLFGRLNQNYMSSKSENLSFSLQPTVEHIMPQGWIANWPLPDGSKGLNYSELDYTSETDPRAVATRARQTAIQTVGNLTILSSGLNSSQSNYGWEQKRPELMKHSLLPLNLSMLELGTWNELAIQKRGAELFERARQIWPK